MPKFFNPLSGHIGTCESVQSIHATLGCIVIQNMVHLDWCGSHNQSVKHVRRIVSLTWDMFNRCVVVLQHLPGTMIIHKRLVPVVRSYREVYSSNQVVQVKKGPINGVCLQWLTNLSGVHEICPPRKRIGSSMTPSFGRGRSWQRYAPCPKRQCTK